MYMERQRAPKRNTGAKARKLEELVERMREWRGEREDGGRQEFFLKGNSAKGGDVCYCKQRGTNACALRVFEISAEILGARDYASDLWKQRITHPPFSCCLPASKKRTKMSAFQFLGSNVVGERKQRADKKICNQRKLEIIFFFSAIFGNMENESLD
jgi:hypothetical protein